MIGCLGALTGCSGSDGPPADATIDGPRRMGARSHQRRAEHDDSSGPRGRFDNRAAPTDFQRYVALSEAAHAAYAHANPTDGRAGITRGTAEDLTTAIDDVRVPCGAYL
jgi:hypothetical protein